MDGSRFDVFSKSFAKGMSRRKAIGGIGGGGLAAMAGMNLHGGAPRVAAQGLSGEVCIKEFNATVRQGPSAGTAISGLLMVRADETGGIEDGTLWLSGRTEDEPPVAVVGQALGRLIGLVIKVGDGQNIYGNGVMETGLDLCEGGMGGTFSGPVEGESGDWEATPGEICQACLDEASTRYNETVKLGRLIKACQAAGRCPVAS